jgi:hypothetical protein
VRYLNLTSFIELKLASGISNPQRGKDIVDVGELIAVLNLPLNYADQLNGYVQAKFRDLWHNSRRRFVRVWKDKSLGGVKSIDEMIERSGPVDELLAMKKDGVLVERPANAQGDVFLVTTDPVIAEKYAMHDESEMWPQAPTEG